MIAVYRGIREAEEVMAPFGMEMRASGWGGAWGAAGGRNGAWVLVVVCEVEAVILVEELGEADCIWYRGRGTLED